MKIASKGRCKTRKVKCRRAVLQVGLMIAYVYIICLSIFYLLGIAL